MEDGSHPRGDRDMNLLTAEKVMGMSGGEGDRDILSFVYTKSEVFIYSFQ